MVLRCGTDGAIQDLLATREFPDVFYLPIDRPGRLRPDAVRLLPCNLHVSRVHRPRFSTLAVIAYTS